MQSTSSGRSGSAVQLGLVDAVKDLLFVDSVFWVGAVVICVILIVIFRRDRMRPRAGALILPLIFYYYLCVMLTKVVGIPTLREYIRLSELGEAFFNPSVDLTPFSDGFSLGFILNILLFAPLGFLCPFISRHYQCVKTALLLGSGLSLSIEIVQLFTLHRATDINDLIANTAGTLAGYFCFMLVHGRAMTKAHPEAGPKEPRGMRYMPAVIIAAAFVLGFFS